MEDFGDFADEVASREGVASDVSGEDSGGFDSDGNGTAVRGFSHDPAAVLGSEVASVEQPEFGGFIDDMTSVFGCEQAGGEEAAAVCSGKAAVVMVHGQGGCSLRPGRGMSAGR